MGLLEKIDNYINLQEKKENISMSLCNESKIDLDDVIKLIKKSKNKERTIDMFPKEIKKQIQKLIDGGIINV